MRSFSNSRKHHKSSNSILNPNSTFKKGDDKTFLSHRKHNLVMDDTQKDSIFSIKEFNSNSFQFKSCLPPIKSKLMPLILTNLVTWT
jgi:hypothetical protein